MSIIKLSKQIVLLWNRAFAYAHLRNRKLRNFTSC